MEGSQDYRKVYLHRRVSFLLVMWIRIRIRIYFGRLDPDPDPGGGNWLTKKEEKSEEMYCFEVLDVLF
jgi:hypothetical protein